jgi:hypothetical protein
MVFVIVKVYTKESAAKRRYGKERVGGIVSAEEKYTEDETGGVFVP